MAATHLGSVVTAQAASYPITARAAALSGVCEVKFFAKLSFKKAGRLARPGHRPGWEMTSWI